MKIGILTTALTVAVSLSGQNTSKILHYTETSGFDHNTRANSFAMFQALGAIWNFTVVDDQTGSGFDDLDSLMTFDAVVFSNTSGDAILNSTQQQNLEMYMANGGGLMGIHAASDTYRHSTANGGSTGTWDWYAETIGGSVQQSPNHVSGQPEYSMSKIGTHRSTDSLPDPWVKNEEYYYWENGYVNTDVVAVLEVEETVGPNGQVNSYDQERPMSWYRSFSNGSRVFYTALGHANSNYTSDDEFRDHIRDALLWLMESGCQEDITSDGEVDINDFLALNSAFGNACVGCPEDINGDGTVDINDFLALNSAFSQECQ